MRDTFYGFFQPTDGEFQELWNDALVILDTNALLNLYRYTSKSRNELLLALQKLSDRLWLPHRIGVEFHRKRTDLIREQRRFHERVKESLSGIVSHVEAQLATLSKNPFIDTRRIVAEVRETVEKQSKHIDAGRVRDLERYGITVQADPVLDTLDRLFRGNVGGDLTRDEWEQIREEGETRYLNQVPPGYLDSKKDGDEKFGDLVIWRQILKIAKEKDKSVIFVTDDAKEDWWWKSDGETIGPRPELRDEFRRETGTIFYAYRVERFVQRLKETSGIDVSAEAVEEVRETSQQAARIAEIRAELRELERVRRQAEVEYSDARARVENGRKALMAARREGIHPRHGTEGFDRLPGQGSLERRQKALEAEIQEVRGELAHNERLLDDSMTSDVQLKLVSQRNAQLQHRLLSLLDERELVRENGIATGMLRHLESALDHSMHELHAAEARMAMLRARESEARHVLDASVVIDDDRAHSADQV